MRQSGVLAAAGLWALDQQSSRIADDHRRAKKLATALDELPVWSARVPETNIILLEPSEPELAAEELCAKLRQAGILCHPNRYREVRLVIHLGIDDDDVETIVQRAGQALA